MKTAVVRLVAAERIKLTSTPSLWWCGGTAVALVVGMMGLAAALIPDLGRVSESVPYVARLGYPVVLVLAALAVTGEQRYGTLRTTFVAVPGRTMVLVAKAAVVAVCSTVLGLAAAFGSWALALVIVGGGNAALDTPTDWRAVAGVGLAYAVVAVLGVGVGLLVRHGAGAVTLLLCWLLAEVVVSSVPTMNQYLSPWMPFTVLNRFTSAELAGPSPGQSIFVEQTLFTPWAALTYAAGVALAVLAAAIVVTRRRDA